MNAPDVSIVIPCYNVEHTIVQQLNALYDQTFDGSYEIIIADNGSTDNTKTVVENEIKTHPNVRLVDASRMPGAAFARNVGIRHSRAEIIMLCDGDDIVSPQWVNSFYETIKSGHDLVTGAVVYWTPGSSQESFDWEAVDQDTIFQPYAKWGYRLVFGGNMGFTKELIRNIQGFDTAFPRNLGAEDLDFGIRAQEKGISVAVCPEALIAYRQRITPTRTFRQKRLYRKGDVLMWVRSKERGHAIQDGISWKRAIREFISLPFALLSTKHDNLHAKVVGRRLAIAGERIGYLEGQIQYRLFSAPPADFSDK